MVALWFSVYGLFLFVSYYFYYIFSRILFKLFLFLQSKFLTPKLQKIADGKIKETILTERKSVYDFFQTRDKYSILTKLKADTYEAITDRYKEILDAMSQHQADKT